MKIQWLILLLLATQSLVAQEKTVLFSIKKKDCKTSYLLGTMHAVPDSIYYFPEKLEKLVAKSDELVLEIGDLSFTSSDLKLLDTANGSAFDIFNSAQKDSVLNYLSTAFGIQSSVLTSQLNRKKPVVLFQLMVQSSIHPPVRFMENELMEQATRNKLTISGLETFLEQLQLLTEIPDSVLQQLILNQVRFPQKEDSLARELVLAYASKDLQKLTQLLTDTNSISVNTTAFIDERNARWIPSIEQKIKNNTCFIAVGAGHLGGPKGLIQLLVDKGYTITPIPY
jgi:uncharacterized protein YbaP (TraB family)